jgi:undecaprenyl-diphosphatase
VPLVLAGLILSFLVMLLFGGTEIDRGLLLLFGGLEAPWLRPVANLIVGGAYPTPLLAAIIAGAFYLFARSRWRDALLLLAVTLGGRLLIDGVQELTHGLRPVVDERLLASQQPGYPSGHAANATVTALALAFLTTRHYPARPAALALAAAFALGAGAGRLIQGASWPSDVIGGWALGLAWTLLLLRLAGTDLGDGTARPLRHSLPKGEEDGKPQDRDRPPE